MRAYEYITLLFIFIVMVIDYITSVLFYNYYKKYY